MDSQQKKDSKACLNCGTRVTKNFCPFCGQEKEKEKHTFYSLFSHFISDLVHYDSSFWRTARYLFLSPGKLSVEYIAGKRKSYVSPFTLYIFISFFSFFILSSFPSSPFFISEDNVSVLNDHKKKEYTTFLEKENFGKKSSYTFEELTLILNKHGKNLIEKDHFLESFTHNIPKGLFLYMPIFTFWMWLVFRNKKKYYFDNGIYTLHLFSVILLTLVIYSLLSYLFEIIKIGNIGTDIIAALAILYLLYYYFWSVKVFYQERIVIIALKSVFVLVINLLLALIIFLVYIITIALWAKHL